MNVSIEKIENGFILTLENKKHFCDVPEAICGLLAEWALKTCEEMGKASSAESQANDAFYRALQSQYAQQAQQITGGLASPPTPLTLLGDTDRVSTWERAKGWLTR